MCRLPGCHNTNAAADSECEGAAQAGTIAHTTVHTTWLGLHNTIAAADSECEV